MPYDKTVEAGEIFCINSGGDLNRGLHIKNGGTVCNNGTISADFIEIYEGGTLINNGTIDTEFIYHRGGEFINNGHISSPSMFIDDANFNNYNIVNIDKIHIQITDTVNSFNNEGVLTSNIFQSIQSEHFDSAYLRYKIYNSGEMYVSEKLMNSSRVDFENSGNLSIGDAIYQIDTNYYYNANFQHCTYATFKNTGQMKVAGNFMNYGDFYTECMIPVGGNMVSSGRITGPLTNSCGGFNIEGNSDFVGYVAADFSYIDICDAGHPSGGFDQQAIQEMGPNVTFCSCNNDCGPIEVFEDFVGTNNYSLYPNPLSETSVLKFYNPVESFHTLVIYDLYGRVAKTQQGIFGDEITVNKEGLKRGIYFFKIASNYNIKAAGKLMVN